MKKGLVMGLGAIALLGVVVSAAWTQGGRGWGRGCGMRRQTMKAKDQQKVADLHQRIRQGQWDLYALQQSGADQERIAQTGKAVAALRDRLHQVLAATRPATCPFGGQPPVGQSAAPLGLGCPWGNQPGVGCAWGCGRGVGRGMGLGMGGWWGGVCLWKPPPAAPKAQ